MASPTKDTSLGEVREMLRGREAWRGGVAGSRHDSVSERQRQQRWA